MKKHYTIALVTESEIFAAGITAILTHIQGSHLTVMRYSPETACDAIIESMHALAIVDPLCLSGPEMKALGRSLKVIGVETTRLPQSISSGCDAVISIYSTPEAIVNTVKQLLTAEEEDKVKCDLSPRERDVVVSIVKGFSNKEIADALNISVNTVMTHRRNIASKLQIHSPAGLTIYAIMNKLIKLSEVKI